MNNFMKSERSKWYTVQNIPKMVDQNPLLTIILKTPNESFDTVHDSKQPPKASNKQFDPSTESLNNLNTDALVPIVLTDCAIAL